jgi:hypothetical protein
VQPLDVPALARVRVRVRVRARARARARVRVRARVRRGEDAPERACGEARAAERQE